AGAVSDIFSYSIGDIYIASVHSMNSRGRLIAHESLQHEVPKERGRGTESPLSPGGRRSVMPGTGASGGLGDFRGLDVCRLLRTSLGVAALGIWTMKCALAGFPPGSR